MLHCEKAVRRHDGRRLKATASLPPGGSVFGRSPLGAPSSRVESAALAGPLGARLFLFAAGAGLRFHEPRAGLQARIVSAGSVESVAGAGGREARGREEARGAHGGLPALGAMGESGMGSGSRKARSLCRPHCISAECSLLAAARWGSSAAKLDCPRLAPPPGRLSSITGVTSLACRRRDWKGPLPWRAGMPREPDALSDLRKMLRKSSLRGKRHPV